MRLLTSLKMGYLQNLGDVNGEWCWGSAVCGAAWSAGCVSSCCAGAGAVIMAAAAFLGSCDSWQLGRHWAAACHHPTTWPQPHPQSGAGWEPWSQAWPPPLVSTTGNNVNLGFYLKFSNISARVNIGRQFHMNTAVEVTIMNIKFHTMYKLINFISWNYLGALNNNLTTIYMTVYT